MYFNKSWLEVVAMVIVHLTGQELVFEAKLFLILRVRVNISALFSFPFVIVKEKNINSEWKDLDQMQSFREIEFTFKI